LVLEIWSRVEEAIPYCQKAITLCQSRLKRLSEDVKPTPLPDKDVNIVNDLGIGGNQASGKGDADLPIEEDEKEVLSGILSELERKVTAVLLLIVFKILNCLLICHVSKFLLLMSCFKVLFSSFFHFRAVKWTQIHL